MLPRTLEPEVMDTQEEAADYNAMDHADVNERFVADFLGLAGDHTGTVLDVGTGTALIPIELARRSSGWQITAIDLAAEMLKLARHNVVQAKFTDRIELQRVDAKTFPFEDGAFDAVISNSIVHHIPEPKSVIAEMCRVLKPGGAIFVRDLMRPPDESTLSALVAQYAGEESDHAQAMFRASLHAALTVLEVVSILEDLGLPARWVRATSDRHWTISGRMPT